MSLAAPPDQSGDRASTSERFAAAPPAPDRSEPGRGHGPSPATPEGKKRYALRKQTPEPVFGIIKSVLGFRQLSLRGLDKVRGEWSLVTLARNIKRMFALKPAAKPQIAPSRAIEAPPTASSHQCSTRKQAPRRLTLRFPMPNNRCPASTANPQSDRLLETACPSHAPVAAPPRTASRFPQATDST